jgi:hypothetical protein
MRRILVGPNLIGLDYYSWDSSWLTSKKAQITAQATDMKERSDAARLRRRAAAAAVPVDDELLEVGAGGAEALEDLAELALGLRRMAMDTSFGSRSRRTNARNTVVASTPASVTDGTPDIADAYTAVGRGDGGARDRERVRPPRQREADVPEEEADARHQRGVEGERDVRSRRPWRRGRTRR